MDVRGSAAALLSARALGTLSAAAFLLLPRDLPIRLSLRDILSCQRDIFSSILEVALPFGLEQMLLYGGNIVITVLLVPLGTAAVTVNAVATSLFGMVTAAAYAAGTLAMTVVGRCAGAGQYRSAFTYGYKITALAFFLLAMGCLLFYPMFPFLLDRLYHVVPPLRAETLHLLKSILIPALLFWSMSSTLPNVLRAAHDTVFPSVLGTLTMWFVRIGLGWVLAFPAGMGLSGLWISMWAEWAVRSLFLGMRYFGSHWLEKVSS